MPFFSRHRVLRHLCSGLRRNQNFEKVTYIFNVFGFFKLFFSPFIFSFCYLFAAVIDLLLGLLPVQKFLKKHHRDGQNFYHGVAKSVAGNFATSYSLTLRSSFVHILGSVEPITLPLAELEYR